MFGAQHARCRVDKRRWSAQQHGRYPLGMIPFAGFGMKIVYAIFVGQGACALIRPGDMGR
jgi:hypothetical protein